MGLPDDNAAIRLPDCYPSASRDLRGQAGDFSQNIQGRKIKGLPRPAAFDAVTVQT
jgi:hypothetical protein